MIKRYCGFMIYLRSKSRVDAHGGSDCAFIPEGCPVSSRYTFPYRGLARRYLNYHVYFSHHTIFAGRNQGKFERRNLCAYSYAA